MIYAAIIGLLLLLIFRFDIHGKANVKTDKAWKVWYYVTLTIMIALPALSYEMGNDIQNYSEWYNFYVKPLDEFSFDDFRYEPLFCLVISLFKTFGLSWFFVYAFIVGFVNYSIFSFGKNYVNHFFTFLLLYFFLHFYEMNFEPIRQSIAMAIFLLAISYLEREEKFKYFACIIVAFGFHISSALALLLPIFKWVRFNIVSYITILFLLIIGNYINTHFSDLVMMTSLIGGEDYYANYLNKDIVNNQLNLNGIIALITLKVLPVILSVKMMKANKSLLFSYLEPSAFFLVAFMALRAAIPLLERFVLYWGVIQVAIIAEALYITKVPRRAIATNHLLRLYFILAFAFNTLIYYNASNLYGFKTYRRFYPYNSILNKQVDTERRDKQFDKR